MEELITINTEQPSAIKVVYEPYALVAEDHELLKKPLDPFDFSLGIDAEEISKRLTQTAKVNRGYGLSANQCGLSYRVFVMGAEEEYFALFNPEIVSVSEETVHLEEGCLSFPFLFLSISRPKTVVVKYQNEKGEINQAKFDGISARVVQHEIDHLNGITFDRVAKPLALKMARKSREKKIKQFAKELVGKRR